MKLVVKIEEVQDHLPVLMTSEIDEVKPFISNAERSHLIALIGKDQFKVFVDTYEAASKNIEAIEDEELREAVFFAQKVAVCLGYFFAVPVLSVNIGTSGIQIFSNQDTKQAFDWQVKDVRKAFCDLGFNALEDLLLLMDENPDKFEAYINSDQKKATEKFLIENATTFDRYFKIGNSRYIFSTICYIMLRIETQVVAKLIGKDFFESLKDNNLDGKQKELVEDYLMPGIALLTAAKAIVERIITFENGVASINLSGNYESVKNNLQATKNDIEIATAQMNADGNQFLQDGLQLVLDNPADFPDYQLPAVKKRYAVKNRDGGGLFST